MSQLSHWGFGIVQDKVATYVASLQLPDGSFTGDKWGEVDTRCVGVERVWYGPHATGRLVLGLVLLPVWNHAALVPANCVSRRCTPCIVDFRTAPSIACPCWAGFI